MAAPQRFFGFKVERMEDIPELRSQAVVLVHEKTGARVLHLFNEDPNNLFSIAFRTPVYDNTGVPHILEHSVLCGSRKFPAKDPFQELLKGSLQTFLNAMTYPDKTVYPVSSQVEKDFFNLVDVYCDATLHPLLTENVFFQEGWHFDVEEPDGPINIKGIVYNEMKGVFSDFSSHVSRKTMSGLLPDTTYFFESGGEPEHITGLTFAAFKDFHAKYYHPSNSFIFLYGNIPTEKTLQFLEEKYFFEFEALSIHSEVKPQKLWENPSRMEIQAPAPKGDDGTATVAVSWVLGNSADPVHNLLGRIFSRYLIGTESSPLKRALIDSGLGEDVDDITGFEQDLIQGIFSVGLRKTRPEYADKVKALIFETLEKEVKGGLDEELLEGSIRRTEFKLREITGGARHPYNLRLAERCYRSWLYGGDPLAHLKFEGPLAFIKSEKKKGHAYFINKMKEFFLENPHHLLSIIKASSEMGKRLESLTQRQVQELSKDFSAGEKRKCYELSKELLAEQKRTSSPETKATLPKLSKTDLPPRDLDVPTTEMVLSTVPVFAHPLFTSGVVYLDMGFDCEGVPYDLLPLLPLYSELIARCGAAGLSYEEMSKRVGLSTGGLSSSVFCQAKAGDPSQFLFKCFIGGKVLPERFQDLLEIFSDLILAPDLSNSKQIKDLLFEMRNDLNSSVISAGHAFAMDHAAARLCRSKHVDETLNGVMQLRFLDSLIRKNNMEELVEKMKAVHSMMANKNSCVASITADNPEAFMKPLESFLGRLPQKGVPTATQISIPDSKGPFRGIEISSSVNFVAKAWKLDTVSPEAMAHYVLLSKNLSTGYLWDKIRVEGGAYGGMAMAKSAHPVFICASYRDPNLSRTLENFEKGLEEAASGLDFERVDQSIIGTIGMIDKPDTPQSRGFGETVALLCGRTMEFRQALRESVLRATPDDLRKAAQNLLEGPDTAVTVLGSPTAFDAAEKEGMGFSREPLLEEEA